MASFAFLVGDQLYAYTHAALHDRPLNDARELSDQMALNARKMITRVGSSLNASRTVGRKIRFVPTDDSHKSDSETTLNCTILFWKDLKRLPLYSKLFCELSQLYRHDARFAREVSRQVWRSLGARSVIDEAESHAAYRSFLLDLYVLHEIAGIISVSEGTDFKIEIYPGDAISIIGKIYKSHWPSLTKLLPSSAKRRFLSLYMADDEIT